MPNPGDRVFVRSVEVPVGGNSQAYGQASPEHGRPRSTAAAHRQ